MNVVVENDVFAVFWTQLFDESSIMRTGAWFVPDNAVVPALPEGDHGPQPCVFRARTCTR